MSTAFDFGASYRALSPIGRGASGVVYEGERKDDGTRVAIKFLRDEYVGDPEILRRFITERSVLTQLSHPHIVGVHDLVADGGKLGIVMEYAPGPNLREYLTERGPLAPADALAITRQVVEALQSAHAGDVVHRDIKPDNIILTALAPDAAHTPDSASHEDKDRVLPGRKKLRGRTEAEDRFNVKVTDFGIAAIIGTGSKTTSIVGTPDYMAPELIAQARATPSVDMYAVGIMLYEMLTGRTPFGGEGLNPFTIAHRHLTEKIAPLAGLEENTAALLDELVGKNPDTRPNAAEVLERLPDCLEATAGHAPLEINTSAPAFYPATMLDGAFSAAALTPAALSSTNDTEKEAPARPAVVLSHENLAELDAAPSATIISSGAALDLNYAPAPVVEHEPSFWEKIGSFIREHWMLVTLGAVTLIAAIAGVVWMLWPQAESADTGPTEPIQARLEDHPLPSGLSIVREAKWNPQRQVIDYTVTYKTAKSPISGNVLEVLPAPQPKDEGGDAPKNQSDKQNAPGTGGAAAPQCADVVWDRAGKPHSNATTSLTARCAWTLAAPTVTVGQPVTITATVSSDYIPEDEQELSRWLTEVSEATAKAAGDETATSTAYPLQRLRSVKVTVPPRIQQGQPIPISIIGVWPNGENVTTPLYTSPASGAPTSILADLTGGDTKYLRFTDRCSGAVTISSDGHAVSALYPAQCEIGAVVGNFDAAPGTIAITGAGS